MNLVLACQIAFVLAIGHPAETACFVTGVRLDSIFVHHGWIVSVMPV